jgi:hypothetical protein
MFFLNLSFPEFAALLGVTTSVVVALYLLSRARLRRKVATLRFWNAALRPETSRQRRRIQQPWSLILQLLALACLLLAIAQPRLGSRESAPRSHVLILDTSSWMAAGARDRSLMDEAKETARKWLDRLPASDRVLLVRADGLPFPVTGMTENRESIAKAVASSRPGAAALDAAQAVTFASEVLRMDSDRRGEIVFVGSTRIRDESAAAPAVANLRFLQVGPSYENCGLRRIGLRRSATNPGEWEVFISARNFGTRPVTVPLSVQFAGAPVAARRIELLPGREQEITFPLRTRAAGWLEARLLTRDALPDDDRAIVEVPAQPPLRVAVFSDHPELLKPLFSANPLVQASYQPAAGYRADAPADVFLLDHFDPPRMPASGVIWLQPPGAQKRGDGDQGTTTARWKVDHEICAGLHANAIQFSGGDALVRQPGDIAIAETSSGPVILARSAGTQRMVLLGYHPGSSESRFDVATPLLFANILRWLKPESFRSLEVNAGTVGAVTVPLDADEDSAQLTVTGEGGDVLPYTIHGRSVRFFAGTPGTVRVASPRGERIFSLTLPEVGEAAWVPPANASKGLPPRSAGPLSRDMWPWLAVAALLLLAVEWYLYGRKRIRDRRLLELALPGLARRAS